MHDDHQPNMRALKREWMSARIVAVFGVLALLAVLGLIVANVLGSSDLPQPAEAVVPTEITPPVDTAAARRAEDIALCDAALATVQGIGLLPGFATRDGDNAEATATQGRYICRAKTTAAKYTIAFDLACTHLGDANCIVPYTIAQDGGGVLYQRH